MSNSQEPQSWSSNPNAPEIPSSLYFQEKTNFAGTLIGSILYGTLETRPPTRPSIHPYFGLGIVIVLFLQCMTALIDPLHRRGEGIKWGLVSYTAVTFSVVTILTAMNLNVLSVSYIDNREFPGEDTAPPGPFGYELVMDPKALTIIPNILFILNDLLADSLLVSYSPDAAFTHRRLTQAPLALSLLCNLLHEPLDHRLPLPHVPWFVRYVLGLPTNR